MVQLFTIVALLIICFAGYVMFKHIEFLLVSVTLYRDMVKQQTAMVGLLTEIRDGRLAGQGTAVAGRLVSSVGSASAGPTGGLSADAPRTSGPVGAEQFQCSDCGAVVGPDDAACSRCGEPLTD